MTSIAIRMFQRTVCAYRFGGTMVALVLFSGLLMPFAAAQTARPVSAPAAATTAADAVAAQEADDDAQLEMVVARFLTAGYSTQESVKLARIALAMPDPNNETIGCLYYEVEAFWCDGMTTRSETYNVGKLCIEAALPTCILPVCPAGQKAFFKVTSSATCEPASTCMYLSVSALQRSRDSWICDSIQDCSCWPTLSCSSAVCAPYNATLKFPSDCPKCP
jgi:hypothetical protein